MFRRDLTYWEENLGLTQQATNRDVSDFSKLLKSVDVLIVGAGFSGSWLAYFLKRNNPKLRISVIERDFINLGASTRNAGFLSCGNISEWYEDVAALGWDEVLRTLNARIEGIEIIKREFGAQLEISNCGSFDFDEPSDEKLAYMEKMNSFLESTRKSKFFEVRKAKIGGTSRLAIFNRFDGEINPGEVLSRLHQSLTESGVQFIWNCKVENIGGGAAALVASNGATQTMGYSHAFICINAFARQFNRNTVVHPARGQVIVTSSVETDTERCLGFLRSGYDYFRFIGNRVLVGGGRLNFKNMENTDEIATTQNLREYLIELAHQVIGHDQFVVDYHWAGIMGLRKGGHASITDMTKPVSLDPKTEEIAGCGGWGVTLMPYIARHRASLFES